MVLLGLLGRKFSSCVFCHKEIFKNAVCFQRFLKLLIIFPYSKKCGICGHPGCPNHASQNAKRRAAGAEPWPCYALTHGMAPGPWTRRTRAARRWQTTDSRIRRTQEQAAKALQENITYAHEDAPTTSDLVVGGGGTTSHTATVGAKTRRTSPAAHVAAAPQRDGRRPRRCVRLRRPRRLQVTCVGGREYSASQPGKEPEIGNATGDNDLYAADWDMVPRATWATVHTEIRAIPVNGPIPTKSGGFSRNRAH